MNKLLTIICLLFLSISLQAQELTIIEPLTHEGSIAASSVPNDNNGMPCAKIIIDLPLDDAVVEGAYIVGNVKEKTGRYEFFVAVPKKEGQKVTVRHKDYQSIDIPLWTADGALAGREAYRVKIKGKMDEKYVVDMHGNKIDIEGKNVEVIVHEGTDVQYLVLNITPTDATIVIDGVYEETKDGHLSKTYKRGKHSCTISHPLYETLETTIEVGNEKETRDINLTPAYGYLNITSEPSGAKVFINGTDAGKTPFRSNALREGHYSLIFSLDGYSDRTLDADVKRNITSDAHTDMAAEFGQIEIVTTPRESQVYINGILAASNTPFVSGRLTEGKYRVRVEAPMHSPKEVDIDVTNGKVEHVDINLSGTYGNITVTSANPEAQIYIDGELKGVGKWSGSLNKGNYTLSSKLPSHRDGTKNIEVMTGESTTIEIPAPTPIYGSLDVSSNPEGAYIFIDGKPYGSTPNLLNQLLIGKHTLTLRKQGTIDKTCDFTIDEGKVTTLDVNMNQGKEITFKMLNPTPIYIDDKIVADKSPYKVNIPYGNHVLHVEGIQDRSLFVDDNTPPEILLYNATCSKYNSNLCEVAMKKFPKKYNYRKNAKTEIILTEPIIIDNRVYTMLYERVKGKPYQHYGMQYGQKDEFELSLIDIYKYDPLKDNWTTLQLPKEKEEYVWKEVSAPNALSKYRDNEPKFPECLIDGAEYAGGYIRIPYIKLHASTYSKPYELSITIHYCLIDFCEREKFILEIEDKDIDFIHGTSAHNENSSLKN